MPDPGYPAQHGKSDNYHRFSNTQLPDGFGDILPPKTAIPRQHMVTLAQILRTRLLFRVVQMIRGIGQARRNSRLPSTAQRYATVRGSCPTEGASTTSAVSSIRRASLTAEDLTGVTTASISHAAFEPRGPTACPRRDGARAYVELSARVVWHEELLGLRALVELETGSL